MFKNEAPYLKEWIDFHFSQGVSFIYITNDNSSDDWEEIVKPYADAGMLYYESSIDHPDFYYREEFHKNRILAKARKKHQWLAFLDSDEFWYSERPYLEVLRDLPHNCSGLVINWLIYGTAHIEDLGPEDLLLEKMNRRFPDGHDEHFQVKTVVRTNSGLRFFNKNPHYPNYSPLAPLFWQDGQRFRPGQKRFLKSPTHIKHFWYRSEKFFREVKRPRRTFFDGVARSPLMEDWHYQRSNAVFDPIPAQLLQTLKAFRQNLPWK
jgi:hypothetical protein